MFAFYLALQLVETSILKLKPESCNSLLVGHAVQKGFFLKGN